MPQDAPFSTTPRGSLIVLALHTLRDVSETLQRGDGGGKFTPESRALEMPAAYKAGFYPDLVEMLLKLRRMGPGHYWHLTERHLFFERTTRDLVAVGSRYFAAEYAEFFVAGEPHRRYRAGEQLDMSCHAVVRAVRQPRAVVQKKNGAAATLVRAAVERWDGRVRPRTVETGLEFLSFHLPRRLELPKEVLAA